MSHVRVVPRFTPVIWDPALRVERGDKFEIDIPSSGVLTINVLKPFAVSMLKAAGGNWVELIDQAGNSHFFEAQ